MLHYRLPTYSAILSILGAVRRSRLTYGTLMRTKRLVYIDYLGMVCTHVCVHATTPPLGSHYVYSSSNANLSTLRQFGLRQHSVKWMDLFASSFWQRRVEVDLTTRSVW